MQLFYTPDLQGDSYILDETESKHCIRVLRLKVGDRIELIDGKGGYFVAEITDSNPKKCSVRVLEKMPDYGKRSWRLHIAIAPTKSIDRFEWFLEKATEIGIDEVTPLVCHNSERKNIKIERLNKVIESAMKQSGKAYHPKLNEVAIFNKFLLNQTFYCQRFIAHCNNLHTRLCLFELYKTNENVLLLIGPEGDFTDDEIVASYEQGYKGISLGSSRLRTETAGIVARHSINFMNILKK